MDDEIRDYYFPADDDDLDEAIEEAKPFVYPTRDELLEGLRNATASAVKLRGTAYYERSHRFINELLDTIVGR